MRTAIAYVTMLAAIGVCIASEIIPPGMLLKIIIQHFQTEANQPITGR
jgi:hypothetical protein